MNNEYSSLTDINGNILAVNKNFLKISGFSEEELIGKTHAIIRHKSTTDILLSEMWTTILNKESWFGIFRNKRKNNTDFWVKMKISPILDKNEKIIYFKAYVKDISKEIDIKQQNVSGFEDNILSGHYKYAGVIKISGLSRLTIKNGLLKTISIEEEITNFFFKLNLNNFRFFKTVGNRYLFLSSNENAEDLSKTIKMVINYLSKLTDENNLFVNVASALISSENPLIVSTEFELALTIARKNFLSYLHYNKDDNLFKNELNYISWQEKTKLLIETKSIIPVFQPIINAKTGVIEKYEVLARGILDGVEISPYYFISHAESLGLISEITKIIIEKSFKIFSENNLEFSINISEMDLLSCDFCALLFDNINLYKIDPKRITIEILENITFSNNKNKIIETIENVKNMGISIAIDDFGSDKSNFARLLSIDIDLIKIDQIFIKNICSSEDNVNIVKAIVNMAKTLNIKTVAEFVENEDIYNLVIECGVDFIQGYYVGKPEKYLIGEKNV